MNHKYMKILSMFLVVVFVLSACAPAATPAVVSPAKTEPTKAPLRSKRPTAPAAANPMDYLNAPREDTVIFDQPYKLEPLLTTGTPTSPVTPLVGVCPRSVPTV